MSVIFERDITPEPGTTLHVVARYDARLSRNVRWTVHDGTIEIRAPRFVRRGDLDRMAEDIVARVHKQRRRARKQHDSELQARAEAINRQYFGGELRWHTIRWVANMQQRLGSCTSGGSTDGDIRISARIQAWPQYVIDYVIAHELAHRKHPNHSKAFWTYLERFPQVERARGFIEGIAFAEHADADALL